MEPGTALGCLATAAAVLLSGLGYGTLLPRPAGRKLGIETPWALGLGVLSLLVMALGVARALTRPGIAAAVGGGLVLLALPGCRGRLREDSLPTGGTLAALALLVPTAVAGLVPPTFFDTLMYHLTLPHVYLQQGSLDVRRETILSFYPQGTEMLFLASYGLSGLPESAAPVHAAIAALACLATASLARVVAGPAAAALAALLLASAPSVLVLATLAKNDMAVVLYVAIATREALHVVEGERPTPALGLAMGMAMAAKYTALYVLAALVAPALVAARRRLPAAGALAMTVALALLPSVPWYLRSWMATGNPVYPTMSGIFGTAPFQRAGFLNPVERRSLPFTELLRVPGIVSFGGSGYGLFSHAGPLFLLLGAAALLLRAGARHTGVLAAFVILDVLLWWRTFNVARFLWPLLPVAASWGAAGFMALRGRLRRGRSLLPLAVGLVVAANVAGAAATVLALTDPVPYLSGREARGAYLARVYPPYVAIDAANRLLPASARVLFVGETRGLYMERPFVASSANDLTPIVLHVRAAASLDDLLSRLRAEGFTHVLHNPVEMARLERSFAPYLHFESPRERQLYDAFVAACRARLLFSGRGVELWEIPPPAEGA